MLLMLLALGSTGPRHHRGVGYDGRWYISRLGGNQRQGHSSRLRDLIESRGGLSRIGEVQTDPVTVEKIGCRGEGLRAQPGRREKDMHTY